MNKCLNRVSQPEIKTLLNKDVTTKFRWHNQRVDKYCSCIHLESEEREDHEAEDGEGHHLGQLLHRVEQRVDDGLQTCN